MPRMVNRASSSPLTISTAWPLARSTAIANSRPLAASLTALVAMILSAPRSEEHTSELQSRLHLVCRLLLEKKKHDHDELDAVQPARGTHLHAGRVIAGLADVERHQPPQPIAFLLRLADTAEHVAPRPDLPH